MSIRDFAGRLGVSDRAISKWEAGGEDYIPRPDSQAMLDTFFKDKVSEDSRTRFEMMLGAAQDNETAGNHLSASSELAYGSGQVTVTSDDEGYPRRITHPVDRKVMALVDEGSFPSGPNNHSAWLPAFYIDIYPTTNQDYSAFVKATGHKPPSHWNDGSFPGELADHPVVNITYRDAESYARWSKKTLPTALEWEKSARGPGGNIYPWGNQETPAKCNVRQTGVGSTTPVDRYHSGVSYYDIYDMSGNVWEWCSTETDQGRFVLKGSAFTSPLSMASGAAMNDASEKMLDDDTGFRCVSTVETVSEMLGFPHSR